VEDASVTSLESAARVGALMTVSALVAGALLVGGLVAGLTLGFADDGESNASSSLLRAGAYALLAVPLLRNVGVAVLDRRPRARLLAFAMSLGLAAIYAWSFTS
jgi:hypothetical protein